VLEFDQIIGGTSNANKTLTPNALDIRCPANTGRGAGAYEEMTEASITCIAEETSITRSR
jgi:hypothetical protein